MLRRAVRDPRPRGARRTKDDYIDSLRRITDLIRSNGATAGIQLGHSGRKARRAVLWEGRVPLAQRPGVDRGEEWELIGPSAIPHSVKFALPREITRAYEDGR